MLNKYSMEKWKPGLLAAKWESCLKPNELLFFERLSICKVLNVAVGIIYNVILNFDIIHEYCFGLWWQKIDPGKQINIDKIIG